jgi:hypothetical protein
MLRFPGDFFSGADEPGRDTGNGPLLRPLGRLDVEIDVPG